ncbi:Hypothetical_protein [Hexamita inflata]|uniref:Hypothetical_protein n=1 Tax=Hexamita inflata TaxID=28002 RepID=A0AA86TDN7_9EUKA|nr:Hypothetical protein HINF_LOCUS1097 [Hexamita inflata]
MCYVEFFVSLRSLIFRYLIVRYKLDARHVFAERVCGLFFRFHDSLSFLVVWCFNRYRHFLNIFWLVRWFARVLRYYNFSSHQLNFFIFYFLFLDFLLQQNLFLEIRKIFFLLQRFLFSLSDLQQGQFQLLSLLLQLCVFSGNFFPAFVEFLIFFLIQLFHFLCLFDFKSNFPVFCFNFLQNSGIFGLIGCQQLRFSLQADKAARLAFLLFLLLFNQIQDFFWSYAHRQLDNFVFRVFFPFYIYITSTILVILLQPSKNNIYFNNSCG